MDAAALLELATGFDNDALGFELLPFERPIGLTTVLPLGGMPAKGAQAALAPDEACARRRCHVARRSGSAARAKRRRAVKPAAETGEREPTAR